MEEFKIHKLVIDQKKILLNETQKMFSVEEKWIKMIFLKTHMIDGTLLIVPNHILQRFYHSFKPCR
jgi:hypothetical protein